jgi:hypothetical protein
MKITLKEAWNIILTVEKAKKQAQNAKTSKPEKSNQLNLNL